MTKLDNETLDAAAKMLRDEKKAFSAPQFSVSDADCVIARVYFELAATKVEAMKQ